MLRSKPGIAVTRKSFSFSVAVSPWWLMLPTKPGPPQARASLENKHRRYYGWQKRKKLIINLLPFTPTFTVHPLTTSPPSDTHSELFNLSDMKYICIPIQIRSHCKSWPVSHLHLWKCHLNTAWKYQTPCDDHTVLKTLDQSHIWQKSFSSFRWVLTQPEGEHLCFGLWPPAGYSVFLSNMRLLCVWHRHLYILPLSVSGLSHCS